jgi:hypothetical protein
LPKLPVLRRLKMGRTALLLAAFAIVVSGESGFQGNVMIRGTVLDPSSHKAAAGAVVYAMSGSDLQSRVTDQRGRFTFLALLPGYYGLYAEKLGHTNEDLRKLQPSRYLDAGYEYDATVWLP